MKKALLILGLITVGGCTYPDPAGYQVFSVEKLRQIKQNPERHTGKLYAFGGVVTDAEQRQDQTVFRMLVQDAGPVEADNNAGDRSLFVVYPSTKTTLAKDHYVKVLGYICEPSVGKNLFGDRVSSLTLDAIAVYDAFTQYAFRRSRDEELFRKWQTGQPVTSD